MITVIDYDTKQPVANAMVSLYDEFNAFIANLGFTDNSGVIMFADFTLSPGGYWFQAGAAGYMINRVSYTVLSEAPINDEIEIAIQKMLIPPRRIKPNTGQHPVFFLKYFKKTVDNIQRGAII